MSDFLRRSCKWKPIEENLTSAEIRKHMKSMMGPQKMIFFEEINRKGLKNIFKFKKSIEITRLWKLYLFIYKKLRAEKKIYFYFIIYYSSKFFEIKCN